MMKRLAAVFLGIFLCIPAHAQWGKILRFGKGTSGSVAKQAELAARIQAQTAKSALLSASQVRRMVVAKDFSARLVPSILASKEAPKLVRNEFLTLSAHKGVRISAKESGVALSLLRRNLLARTGMLDNVANSISAPLDPFGSHTELALEALAAAYGVGWYGSKQDGPSLVKLYQTLAASELEPVAFTAAARGLVALKDYQNLEYLLLCAPRTQAYESFVHFLENENYPVKIPAKSGAVQEKSVSAYKEPMSVISEQGASLFDFSVNASFQYVMTASRLQALREVASSSAPAAKPAVPSASALQRALAEAGREPSALALETPVLPSATPVPQAPETPSPTFEETPRVMTLATVPYVKDLKKPNLDQLRASTMVGDGLDATRDLLSVQRAEGVLHFIPHLKATIYPQARLAGQNNLPPFLDGGGLGAYLALFTPDFFPLKKVNRLRWVDGKLRIVPEYFVRKEVPALSGTIHRNHITFTEQIEDRAVDK